MRRAGAVVPEGLIDGTLGVLAWRVAVGIVTLAASAIAWPALAQEASPSEGTAEETPAEAGAPDEEAPADYGQSRESMAVDTTASQWSFQFAFQGFPEYREGTLDDGTQRPEGRRNFSQLRIVAPIVLPRVTVLPRLTVRLAESATGSLGLNPTDLFALVIPRAFEWSSGRAGFGPNILFPSASFASGTPASAFGPSVVQLGLAGAIIQRAWNDRIVMGLLVQQAFGPTAADNSIQPGPIVINPFFTLQIWNGIYVSTNDLQMQINWQTGGIKAPIGGRLGYAWVLPSVTFNFYGEYGTEVGSSSWRGSLAEHYYRLNVTFQIPVG
ncbi:MAG: hypothetical protein ACFCGT_11235 [Sandaracinaceae bacterium]